MLNSFFQKITFLQFLCLFRICFIFLLNQLYCHKHTGTPNMKKFLHNLALILLLNYDKLLKTKDGLANMVCLPLIDNMLYCFIVKQEERIRNMFKRRNRGDP